MRKFLVVIAALAAACASASSFAGKLPDGAISASANGSIEIDPATMVGVRPVFAGSPILTDRLKKGLEAKGVKTSSEESAPVTLRFEGSVTLSGGPKYQKAVRADVGAATEKTLDAEIERVAEERSLNRGDAFRIATDAALVKAAYNVPMSNFMRGLPVSQLAFSIGEATGARSWFNKLVAGDPRGICLNKCQDWNKVDQRVHMTVVLETPDGKQQIRVLASAFADEVAPEEVIESAIDAALGALKLKDSGG